MLESIRTLWLLPVVALVLHSHRSALALKCHCSGYQGKFRPCLANNTCHSMPGEIMVCYKAVSKLTGFDNSEQSTYGCFYAPKDTISDFLPGVSFPIRCLNVDSEHVQTYTKCCNQDDCNVDLNVTMPEPVDIAVTTSPSKRTGLPKDATTTTVVIALSIVIPIAALCIVLFLFYCFRLRPSRHAGGSFDTETDPMLPTTGGSFIQQLLDLSNSGSGGGAGLPLMMQITIARQIQLEEVVGMGRFGDVKRGKWRGDNVAVKIFHSREEASWFREAEIYQTCLLRHDNILGFIAADNIDNGTLTQLLLVTEFHEKGSLYNHLNNVSELDTSTMIVICHTIACGLAHLHMEIFGKQGKPAIAHRDLKSKNILVKRDGMTCCIADMGLAVKHQSTTDTVNLPAMNDRVGTNRYMAPEVLSDAINMQHFDSYKQGDVYSLSLVYWEVVRRTSVGEKSKCEDYQLPYFDLVPSDPTVENMRYVVCEKNRRPTISNRWHDITSFRTMAKLIKECWHEKPAARLTALRIKKTLTSLAESEKVRYVQA